MKAPSSKDGARDRGSRINSPALGVRYFTVAAHGSPCPLCWPWQGAVLVETMPEHPEIPVDATIAEAVSAGLFHPNCRHTLIAVYPGITVLPERTPWGEAQQAAYDASQRQRALEREIRKAKQAARDALTDEAAAKARTDVRRWQKRLREHVAETGRARDSRREQINLGQDRHRSVPTAPTPRRAVAGTLTPTGPRIEEVRLHPRVEHPGRIETPEGLHLEPHEVATAQRLAAVGINVRWRPLDHTPGTKNPDAFLNDEDGVWDFKSPKGSEPSNISNQLRDAKKQGARRVVIDMARSPLDETTVFAELRRRLTGSAWFTDVIFVQRDEHMIWLSRA